MAARLAAPVILSQPRELLVGAGSNISLSCSATGAGTLDIVWFQDQQNLNSTAAGRLPSGADSPTSTLLLERRYEIAMDFEPPNTAHSSLFLYNLKPNDTGLFICSVKNEVGTSYTNHSLLVTDSAPAVRFRDAPGNAPPLLETTNTLSRNSLANWWDTLSQNSDTQLGLVALVFVVILLAAVILLLILKNYSKRSNSSSASSSSNSSAAARASAKSAGGLLASLNLFKAAGRPDDKNSKPHSLDHHRHNQHQDDDDDDDDDCSSASSSSSCRKNAANQQHEHAHLGGFIEQLRSGIINMDYHAMSPVLQFNNQTKNTKVSQQHQHQPPQYTYPNGDQPAHPMHHFPSASNTSSLPYYSQGSVSMSTTLSNLSPTSANNQMLQPPYTGAAPQHSHHQHPHQLATNNGPASIINCDMQHRLNGADQMAPPTNTTTTSYTSDYQSGYGDAHDPQHQHQPLMAPPANNASNTMVMPPMYYETAPEQINYPSHLNHHHHHHHHHQFAGHQQAPPASTSLLLNGAYPVASAAGGVPTYLMLHQQQQQQPQQPGSMQAPGAANTSTLSRNTAAARMLANRALCQDQDLAGSRPSLSGAR